jgi:hypothetical protein
MVVDFTMFNQGKTVRCAISTAAMDDLEGKREAPACIRRQNFMRRFVGYAIRQERANFAKKRFAATFGGLYALPFCH